MLVSSLARAFARSSRGAIRTIPRAFSGIPIPEGSFKNTDDGPDRISLEPRTTLKGRKRFYKRTGYRESPERPGFFEVRWWFWPVQPACWSAVPVALVA